MLTQALPTLYQCPGEAYPITRAVHLSRLAAFYPKCRNCPHRNDTGQLPQQTIKRLQKTECRVQRPSLFTDEGVRGVYLNELSRQSAGKMTGALASVLWDQNPLVGRDPRPATREFRRGRDTPLVAIGYDERPASPDLAIGAAAVLRRMGCSVVDVGLASRACFAFAVAHLQAAAGIYITGAGCDPSWSGLDFVGRRGEPLSRGFGLDEIEGRFLGGYGRPTRQGGAHRVFQAAIPYHAGLWKHFHALRPLRVCCGCSVRGIQKLLKDVFAKLPCDLHWISLPVRARQWSDHGDPDVLRLGEAVRQTGAHLGILIDDDGMRCGLLDEKGEIVSPLEVTRILANVVGRGMRNAAVVLDTAMRGELQPSLEADGIGCHDGGRTHAGMWRMMNRESAETGAGPAGFYWFREGEPVCDAVVTLAKVLQALSCSDAAFSRVTASVCHRQC